MATLIESIDNLAVAVKNYVLRQTVKAGQVTNIEATIQPEETLRYPMPVETDPNKVLQTQIQCLVLNEEVGSSTQGVFINSEGVMNVGIDPTTSEVVLHNPTELVLDFTLTITTYPTTPE